MKKDLPPFWFSLFSLFFYTEYYPIFNQNLILDKGKLSLQIATTKKYTYFIYLINKVMQHQIPLCEKVIAPLHSIPGCATFSCNDYNQMLPAVVYQSLTSLWRNFDPLLHAELL